MKIYSECVEIMEARRDEPHRRELTAFQLSMRLLWTQSRHVNRVSGRLEIRGSELTAPLCAVALLWVIGGAQIKRGTLRGIGERSGITWAQTAGLVAMNDAGMSWEGMASALNDWRRRPRMQTKSVAWDTVDRVVEAGLVETRAMALLLKLCPSADASDATLPPLPSPSTARQVELLKQSIDAQLLKAA
jgi:hypothetical protein